MTLKPCLRRVLCLREERGDPEVPALPFSLALASDKREGWGGVSVMAGVGTGRWGGGS